MGAVVADDASWLGEAEALGHGRITAELVGERTQFAIGPGHDHSRKSTTPPGSLDTRHPRSHPFH